MWRASLALFIFINLNFDFFTLPSTLDTEELPHIRKSVLDKALFTPHLDVKKEKKKDRVQPL